MIAERLDLLQCCGEVAKRLCAVARNRTVNLELFVRRIREWSEEFLSLERTSFERSKRHLHAPSRRSAAFVMWDQGSRPLASKFNP